MLVEWDIIPSKVGNILTDNGSNMIKAFKNVQATQTHESGESSARIERIREYTPYTLLQLHLAIVYIVIQPIFFNLQCY